MLDLGTAFYFLSAKNPPQVFRSSEDSSEANQDTSAAVIPSAAIGYVSSVGMLSD